MASTSNCAGVPVTRTNNLRRNFLRVVRWRPVPETVTLATLRWRTLALSSLLFWAYGCTIPSMANLLKFEAWKSQLRQNCDKEGKLAAFTNLGDFVLLLLFERGVEPTPRAIVEDGNKVA